MNVKGSVKVIAVSAARRTSARYSELLVELIDRDDDEYADVVILRLVGNGIERKVIRKPVARVANLGWVVTLRVTKKTGAVLFVPKSRLARRSVRLRHGTFSQRVRATRLKRLVICDLS